MKLDIILSGVGGQGILSIATVIGEAAKNAGIYLKQAEVHGMSQRGGDVQSNLRLSTEAICSDLIPMGAADLIISMEPMEALRYLPYLSKDGKIVTASKPFVNIPNYPDQDKMIAELKSLPYVTMMKIEELAVEAASVKAANMVLLGMAAPYLNILSTSQIKEAVKNIFRPKGESIMEGNLRAFEAGLKSVEGNETV